MVPSIERFHCSRYTYYVCHTKCCTSRTKWLLATEEATHTAGGWSVHLDLHNLSLNDFCLLPVVHCTPSTQHTLHNPTSLPTLPPHIIPHTFHNHSHTPYFHHIVSGSRPPPLYKLTSSLRSHCAIESAVYKSTSELGTPPYTGQPDGSQRCPL